MATLSGIRKLISPTCNRQSNSGLSRGWVDFYAGGKSTLGLLQPFLTLHGCQRSMVRLHGSSSF